MLDHVLAVFFALGFPLVTTPIYLKRRAAMLAGETRVRRREYLETIAWLTSMGIGPVALWLLTRREFADLGLSTSVSWRVGVALGIAALASGLLMIQVRAVRRDSVTREAAREALEPVREYFPTTPAENRLFWGVSVAAGIGEEVFYRGFLLWYMAPHLTLPWAIALSSALFGLAHVMHGFQATLRSTLMGAVLAGLYVFSGSLWASMLLHTVVDLSSGETGAAAFADSAASAA